MSLSPNPELAQASTIAKEDLYICIYCGSNDFTLNFECYQVCQACAIVQPSRYFIHEERPIPKRSTNFSSEEFYVADFDVTNAFHQFTDRHYSTLDFPALESGGIETQAVFLHNMLHKTHFENPNREIIRAAFLFVAAMKVRNEFLFEEIAYESLAIEDLKAVTDNVAIHLGANGFPVRLTKIVPLMLYKRFCSSLEVAPVVEKAIKLALNNVDASIIDANPPQTVVAAISWIATNLLLSYSLEFESLCRKTKSEATMTKLFISGLQESWNE